MVDAAGRAAETHCGDKTNRANVSRGSISVIHTFLSITVRFFLFPFFSSFLFFYGLLNNGNCRMCFCGAVRSGAAWSCFSPLNFLTGFHTAASVSPLDHSPITGQLGDLLALACGTPSRGWSQSQDWWSLVRKGAGAQARSLLESRYNEKLPVAGSVIKLSSSLALSLFSFFILREEGKIFI